MNYYLQVFLEWAGGLTIGTLPVIFLEFRDQRRYAECCRIRAAEWARGNLDFEFKYGARPRDISR